MFNEVCKEGTDCKNLSVCPLRHPKMCERTVMEEYCVFQDECAYNHNRRINSQTKEMNTLHEEVKILKIKIHTLKINFKQLLVVRAEFEVLEESVKYVKKNQTVNPYPPLPPDSLKAPRKAIYGPFL